MFKKLKDKIAEEVKQSPARFQEIINSAQVSSAARDRCESAILRSGVEKEKKKQIKLVCVNKLLFFSAICLFTFATVVCKHKFSSNTSSDFRQLLVLRARVIPTKMLRAATTLNHPQPKTSFHSRKMTLPKTVQ